MADLVDTEFFVAAELTDNVAKAVAIFRLDNRLFEDLALNAAVLDLRFGGLVIEERNHFRMSTFLFGKRERDESLFVGSQN